MERVCVGNEDTRSLVFSSSEFSDKAIVGFLSDCAATEDENFDAETGEGDGLDGIDGARGADVVGAIDDATDEEEEDLLCAVAPLSSTKDLPRVRSDRRLDACRLRCRELDE